MVTTIISKKLNRALKHKTYQNTTSKYINDNNNEYNIIILIIESAVNTSYRPGNA